MELLAGPRNLIRTRQRDYTRILFFNFGNSIGYIHIYKGFIFDLFERLSLLNAFLMFYITHQYDVRDFLIRAKLPYPTRILHSNAKQIQAYLSRVIKSFTLSRIDRVHAIKSRRDYEA